MHPLLHLVFALAGITLLAITLPLVIELAVLSLAAALPARRQHLCVEADNLRLAVIIPAHNEEKLISACVVSLVASTRQTDIYVIAHNCTDGTASAAAAAGATVLSLNDAAGGKGAALHFGFTAALEAGAEAVMVIDADSTVSPNLISRTASAFAFGAGATQCRYLAANPEASTKTRLMSLSLLGMNVVRPRGRSRLGLSCGIFGNGFALSSQTLRAVPYLSNSVVEDLEYHLNLGLAGIPVKFLDDAYVLGELPDSLQGASTQRARWEGGRLLMRHRWSMPLLRQVLSGNFKALEPLLDLLSVPIATGAALLILALAPPLSWLRVYSLFGLASVALYITVAASLGPSPAQTMKAVASVPGYLLWKLAMVPRTRRAARADAAWIRTERNHSNDSAK